MTYEELLADIASKNYRESRTPETPYAALRAVLEVHKPMEFLFNDEPVLVCSCCQHGVVGDRYPCKTAKAIAKELA
jgi:hypothetical protein